MADAQLVPTSVFHTEEAWQNYEKSKLQLGRLLKFQKKEMY